MTINIQNIRTDIQCLRQDLTDHCGLRQKTVGLASSLFQVLANQHLMNSFLGEQEGNSRILATAKLWSVSDMLCERVLEGAAWPSFFHTLSAIYNYITSWFDSKFCVSNTDRLLSIMNSKSIMQLLMLMRYKACIAVMHEVTGDNRSSSFARTLQQCLGMSPMTIAMRQVAKIKELCVLCEQEREMIVMIVEIEHLLLYVQGLPLPPDSPLMNTLDGLKQEHSYGDVLDNIVGDIQLNCNTAMTNRETSQQEKMQYRIVCATLLLKNSQMLYDESVQRASGLVQECNWKEGCDSQNPLVQAFAKTSNKVCLSLGINELLPYFSASEASNC